MSLKTRQERLFKLRREEKWEFKHTKSSKKWHQQWQKKENRTSKNLGPSQKMFHTGLESAGAEQAGRRPGGVEDVQGTAKDVPTLDRHQSRPGGSEGTSKTPTRPHPGTAHPSCRNPSQNPGSSLGVGWGEQTLSYRARDTVTEDISLKPRKQEESRVNQVLSVQRKRWPWIERIAMEGIIWMV